MNHPQLIRFRAHPQPLEAVAAYLSGLADEADARGYSFNRALIGAGEHDAGENSTNENSAGKNGTGNNCADKAGNPYASVAPIPVFWVSWSTSSLSCGTRWRGATPSGSIG